MRTTKYTAIALVMLGAAKASAQPAPAKPPMPTPPVAPGADRPVAPNTPPAPVLQPAPPSTPPAGPQPISPAAAPTLAPNAPAPAAMPLAPSPPEPDARQVTLEDAISTAVANNVESRTSESEIEGAEASRMGSRGELLPRLRGEGAMQQWNGPFEIAFGPQKLTVREAFTWTASAIVIQPITGLIFSGLDKAKADRLGVDIAKLQRDTTKRDVAFRVAEQYLRLLEAKRLVEVARASVTSLEAQRRQAQSLHNNGVIAKNDLLRAELAVSNAKQREIQARGNVILGRGRLAMLMGLKPGERVDAAPFASTSDPSAAAATTVEVAETQSQRRLEVAAFGKKIEQADARVGAAKGRLLPQINATANYTHFSGSAFQQADAAYVGLVGSWDVWDWGATYAQSKEAASRRDEATLAKERVEEQVRLEARQAAVDAQTAREALTVAKTALAQAEENYRIVSLRYEQAQSTTFDVVDAESLLTQARAQVENATYGWLVAQLGLQRATGEGVPRVR
jgi:outer membrane protein TolC